MEGPLQGMLAHVYVLSAAGRIIFEHDSPSLSSVSEYEQQEALEGFGNEQVGLIWGVQYTAAWKPCSGPLGRTWQGNKACD